MPGLFKKWKIAAAPGSGLHRVITFSVLSLLYILCCSFFEQKLKLAEATQAIPGQAETG
jgi:hypothetical protein